MLPVDISSSHTSSSPALLPKGFEVEVQALEKAIAERSWSHVRELSQSLVTSGRERALLEMQNKRYNPLPIAKNLYQALGSSDLEWEDKTLHLLARSARFFLELTCMKSVNEGKELNQETKASLRSQIDKLLQSARADQVGLQYELNCSLAALKILEQPETKEVSILMEALAEMSVSSIPMSKEWYHEVLYLSWTGTLARDSLPLFESHCKRITEQAGTLEVAQVAVEFFGDTVLSGTSEIAFRALAETPSLITLATQQDPKRTLANVETNRWPVRYRAVEILTALTRHQNSQIAKVATEALFNCSLRESHPKVRKLFDELEKHPEIRNKWKELFEAGKSEIVELTTRQDKELERHENALKMREDAVLKDTTIQHFTWRQLAQEKNEIEQERQFINELRQESLAYKSNIEKMQTLVIKGRKRPLDAMTISQPTITAPNPLDLFKQAEDYLLGRSGKTQNIEKAIGLLKEAAELGDPDSQFYMGWTNDQLSKKNSLTKTLLENLAKHGDLFASGCLALYECSSPATRESDRQSNAWYKKALDQGHPATQFLNGTRLFKSHYPASFPEAVEFYLKSAQQGYAPAQFNLGYCYANGLGLDKNDKEAIKWYTKAAERGHVEAQFHLAFCYGLGNEIKASLSANASPSNPSELFKQAEAYLLGRSGLPQNVDKAIGLIRQAAELGHPEAQCYMGWLYDASRLNGMRDSFFNTKNYLDDTENDRAFLAKEGNTHEAGRLVLCGHYASYRIVDAKQSEAWYRKAAEQGDARGMTSLGTCYSTRRDSFDEAIKWYTKAAERGYPDALYQMGQCYLNHSNWMGNVDKKDEQEARKWFIKAAEQGQLAAQVFLAQIRFSNLQTDLDEDLKWLTKAGERGYASAQYSLGQHYAPKDPFSSRETNPDDKESFKWFRLAAEQGMQDAQSSIGRYYFNGWTGVDDVFKWFLERAERGDKNAQSMVAMGYFYGRGVNQDDKEGIKWTTKAADAGDHNASEVLKSMPEVLKKRDQFLLEKAAADLLISQQLKAEKQQVEKRNQGFETPNPKPPERPINVSTSSLPAKLETGNTNAAEQLDVEAFKRDQQTAKQGDLNAQFRVGWSYDIGKGVKKDDKLAVIWYTKAAEQGHANAQFNLGNCYDDGRGVNQDDKLSAIWYTKAADQGFVKAQFNLGISYKNGRGVSQDHKQAVKWFTKAAEQGYANAQFNLGVCYENGRGVNQDHKLAVIWYTKAAEQGYANAQFNLGGCYDDGCGVSQDHKLAVKWFTKAAEQGFVNAQYNLAYSYLKGEGVEQNHLQAVNWFTKAAEKGDADSQYELGCCYKKGLGVNQDSTEAFKWFTIAAQQGHKAAQQELENMKKA